MGLDDIVARLSIFGDDQSIANIIVQINEINKTTENKLRIIESLRRELLKMLSTPKYMVLKKSDKQFVDICYDILIYLAKEFPLNNSDPIMLEDFKPQTKKIETSSGQVFDLESLIESHHARAYRYAELGETAESTKWFLNPANNIIFNSRDVKRIKAAADFHLIMINQLKTVDVAYLEGKEIVNASRMAGMAHLFASGKKLLMLAADQGNSEAAFLLSQILFDPSFVWQGKHRDFAMSLKYLNLAVELNNKEARLFKISLLNLGSPELGIEAVPKEARKLLVELANEDYMPAILLEIELLTDFDSQKRNTSNDDDDEEELSSKDAECEAFIRSLDFRFDRNDPEGSKQQINGILKKYVEFSDAGSVKATNILIQLYQSGDAEVGILPDMDKVAFYRQQLINLAPPEEKELISLLHRASDLGGCGISCTLGRLYLNISDTVNCRKLQIAQNIKEGMNYLHLSLNQGGVNAAFILSAIYQHHSFSSNAQHIGEDVLREVPAKATKALSVLKKGLENANNDFDKGRLAHAIAELYLANPDLIVDVQARRGEIIRYFEMAKTFSIPDAIAQYGCLLLKGDPELQITPNARKADLIFHSIEEYYCYKITNRLRSGFDSSPENIARYLYWIFKEAESSAPQFDRTESALRSLHDLVETGEALPCSSRTLKITPDLAIANKIEHLLKHKFFSASLFDEERQSLFPRNELIAIMKDVYKHCHLEAPFGDTYATHNKGEATSFMIGQAVLTRYSPVNRPVFCTFFSGGAFSRVAEAEVENMRNELK